MATYNSDCSREEILELLHEVDETASGFNDWEIDFISNLVDDPPDNFSDKQIDIIQRIYDNWC